MQTGSGKDHIVTGPWFGHSRKTRQTRVTSLHILLVLSLQLLLRYYGQKRLRLGALHSEEASSLQATAGDARQWHNHTSGVRLDGAKTPNAGQCQVKTTQASTPCVLGDESDQQLLFQNGEAGLLGEAFSLLTTVQSCTKPRDVSAALQQLPQHCQ